MGAGGRERLAQKLGLDIQDAVGEAGVGRGLAVVRLVGIQEVQLAGQADVAPAPVAKGLHAGRGDPDRVGVVPVRREPAGRKVHLRALEPGAPAPIRIESSRALHDRSRRSRSTPRSVSAMTGTYRWDALGTLIVTALAIMGTPGPATISLTAAGSAYGVRRSLTLSLYNRSARAAAFSLAESGKELVKVLAR